MWSAILHYSHDANDGIPLPCKSLWIKAFAKKSQPHSNESTRVNIQQRAQFPNTGTISNIQEGMNRLFVTGIDTDYKIIF